MPHPFVDLGTPIIAALGATSALTLRRFGLGAYNAQGTWVPTAPTLSTIDAVVQPSSPRQLEQVPENERTSEGITVFTRSKLLTADVQTGQQADELVWSGRTWKVVLVEDWTAQAKYARSIAVRLGV
jgi:hypothetical protein